MNQPVLLKKEPVHGLFPPWQALFIDFRPPAGASMPLPPEIAEL